MSNLPTFERMLPAQSISKDEEVFVMPQWNCFCCQDTGMVCSPELRKVIPGYDYAVDKPVLCQRSKCSKGGDFDPSLLQCFDLRFDATICQTLHQNSYEDWQNSRAAWYEAKKAGRNLIVENVLEIQQQIEKSSGRTKRNANDEREIQLRKQQAQDELDFPMKKVEQVAF